MAIWHSSQLGWTAGQDVSAKFASLVKTFKAGDTFVLDHMYKISGSFLKLPDDFTLSAVTGGGFSIQDGAKHNNILLDLGNQNTLHNVTISHSGLPTGGNLSKKTIRVMDKDDVHVVNCKFEGNVGTFMDVYGSERFTLQSTHFEGAYGQLRLIGNNLDTRVDSSTFEGSLGDGIKTLRDNGLGVQRAKITNSVFEDNARDGIDTTGGFKDSLVSNSIFRNNDVSGMDIKTVLESSADLNVNQMNKNITIQNSQFINNRNAVVVTTNDRGDLLNKSNASQWAVQEVKIRDSIVENTSGHVGDVRAFLIKDAHDIYWSNIKLLGIVEEKSIWPNTLVNDPDVNAALNYNIVGTNTAYGSARPLSDD